MLGVENITVLYKPFAAQRVFLQAWEGEPERQTEPGLEGSDAAQQAATGSTPRAN
jgi:hypothetical protein